MEEVLSAHARAAFDAHCQATEDQMVAAHATLDTARSELIELLGVPEDDSLKLMEDME